MTVRHGKQMLDFAAEIGVEAPKIVIRSRHPAILGTVSGQRILHVFPGTPSDHRAMVNAKQQLKRRVMQMTDDKPKRQDFSASVKREAWLRSQGKCAGCGKKLFPGDHRHFDHIVPTGWLKGDATVDNCQVLCAPCHTEKTGEEATDRARGNKAMEKVAGIERPKRKIPGSKGTGFVKKLDGSVWRRE
jgi:5-methylcytosine-specific restriction endonuclease McrA